MPTRLSRSTEVGKKIGPNVQTGYLRAPDAAEHLGLKVSTLAKMRVCGGGPVFARLGRAIVYDPADLADWVASKKRHSTSG